MDDSKTFVTCNLETVKDIRDRVINIKTFLEQYKWIADAYVSDFFVHGFWSRLPTRWTEYLRTLSPSEISFLLKQDGHTYRQVPPLSLLSFRMCVLSLALGRCPADLDKEEVVNHILSSLKPKHRIHSDINKHNKELDQKYEVSKEGDECESLNNETVDRHSPTSDQRGGSKRNTDNQFQIYNQSTDVKEQISNETDNTQERDRKMISRDELDHEIRQLKIQKGDQPQDDLIPANCTRREQESKICTSTSHKPCNTDIDQSSPQENTEQKSDKSNNDIIENTNKDKVFKTTLSTKQDSCCCGMKVGMDCMSTQQHIEDDTSRPKVPSIRSSTREHCSPGDEEAAEMKGSSLNSSKSQEIYKAYVRTYTDCRSTPHQNQDAGMINVPQMNSTPKKGCTLEVKTGTDSESTGQHDEEAARTKVGGRRSAGREEWRGVMKNGQWMELEHIYRKHIKPKKQHEIQKLSQAISFICCLSQSDQVVDVGAGLGHLSRLLTFGHGVKVTTVEASGGHAPKAGKYDRETKKDIKKAKKKKLKLEGKETAEDVPVSLPSHISCMIHPNISTPHFLDLIRHSRSQQHTDTGEQTVTDGHLECVNKMGENREEINSVKSNGRTNLLVNDHMLITNNGDQKDRVSHFDEKNRKDGNCENSLAVYNGLDSEQKGVIKNNLKHINNLSRLDRRKKVEECDKSKIDITTADLGMDTNVKINGLVNSDHVSKVDYAPTNSINQREHLSESTGTSKCGRSCIENTSTVREKMCTAPRCEKNTPQEDREEFVLAGLHACGDLTPTVVRMFVNCKAAVGLASVGCCYMKLSRDRNNIENTEPGYPMSLFVSGLLDPDLSYSARELACHFADAYIQRLQDNPPHLKIHSYRAALQHVITSLIPDFQHGVTKLTIKNAVEKPFETYAKVAMEKLGHKSAIPSDLLAEAESYLPLWKDVVIFYTIRLSLAPVIETLVLLDRMLYLFEHGIPSALVPIFDPKLSPRNFVLLALKPDRF